MHDKPHWKLKTVKFFALVYVLRPHRDTWRCVRDKIVLVTRIVAYEQHVYPLKHVVWNYLYFCCFKIVFELILVVFVILIRYKVLENRSMSREEAGFVFIKIRRIFRQQYKEVAKARSVYCRYNNSTLLYITKYREM